MVFLSVSGKWQWVSETPSLLPPCQDAVSFYSQYGRNTKFTSTPMGQRFQDLHAHHLKLLEWQGSPHPLLSIKGEQARHYHLVLPSFFHLLESLHREGRQFAVVFRTFGTDLPRVLQAVHCALEGQHPHFPALQDISVSGLKGMLGSFTRFFGEPSRCYSMLSGDACNRSVTVTLSENDLCFFPKHWHIAFVEYFS